MPTPYATPAQQSAFVQNVFPYAQWASSKSGLPVDFIIGQAATESGYGLSSLAVNQNNYFGIGGPGHFASYGDIGQSFSAWVNTITGNYNTSSFGGMSASQMADSLASQGYTHDAGYGSTVGAVTGQIDKILSGLKLDAGTAAAGSGTAPGGASAKPSNCGQFDYVCQLQTWFSQVSFGLVWVIVGLVLLIGALALFAKNSGIADKVKLPPVVIPV